MNRGALIEELDSIYGKLYREGLGEKAEEILMNNNASENDSDPDEGYMSTMADVDLKNAIKEMKQALNKIAPESVEDMIYALQSGTQDVSDEYIDGFIDACKMITNEFGISIKGI